MDTVNNKWATVIVALPYHAMLVCSKWVLLVQNQSGNNNNQTDIQRMVFKTIWQTECFEWIFFFIKFNVIYTDSFVILFAHIKFCF